jgi:hypothetical protein
MPIECVVFAMNRAGGVQAKRGVEKAPFDPHLYPCKLACPSPLA